MGQKYNQKIRADKTVEILGTPDHVYAGATTAIEVGKGNLCRVKGTSGGFVKFGESDVEIPSSSTKNTLETEAGYFIITASDDFIRTSVSMRVEVILD